MSFTTPNLRDQESNTPAAEISASNSGAEDAGAALSESTASAKNKKKREKAKAKKRAAAASVGEPIEQESSTGTISFPTNTSKEAQADAALNALRAQLAKQFGPGVAAQMTRENASAILSSLEAKRAAGSSQEELIKTIEDHKFWKTQPVTKSLEVQKEGPIQPAQPESKISKTPLPLPADFEWVQVDIDNPQDLTELHDLLYGNYAEDEDESLRFRYSAEFLNWALKHPGYHKSWHVGVRVKSTGKLVGFIAGIPLEIRVRDVSYRSTEINFLCVHKKLRSKRLAPVLIKEVTRQCHLSGVFQAIYTGGTVIPTPMSCARYYHRTIQAEKLLDIGFAAVPEGMPRDMYVRRYDLPSVTSTKGLREMEKRDVVPVAKLLRRYLRKFDMAPRFGDEEVAHLLLSGRGVDKADGTREKQVTWTYVVENDEGKITDMISFYSLPSSILDHDKYDAVNAAYLFYYATDVGFADNEEASASASTSAGNATAPPALAYATVPEQEPNPENAEPYQLHNKTKLTPAELEDERGVLKWDFESPETKKKIRARLNELVNDTLIIAMNAGFDVMNCLTVMDNPMFLSDQKFGPGSGFLRFYLFNWHVRPVNGGMGNRPREPEADPMTDYYKTSMKALSDGQSLPGGVTKVDLGRVLRTRARPDEWGSGNGVTMV